MANVTWAEAQHVTDVGDCHFYHTMDIPGHGTVQGEWDLRGREAAYLGNVPLAGKQVLEIGPASGHLCFSMERMGANVTAYDLSPQQEWDIVPYAKFDFKQHIAERKAHLARLNKAYWFAHRAFQSKARVAYGTVYDLPDDIGQFDVATFGSVLLHLRDPFLALQRVTAHVRDAVVITDIFRGLRGKVLNLAGALTGMPLVRFLPNVAARTPSLETWWNMAPVVVAEFVKILGFPRVEISYDTFMYKTRKTPLYTVVGRR